LPSSLTLFQCVAEVDKEVSRINGTAADGLHLRLREVKLAARDLECFTTAAPSIYITNIAGEFVPYKQLPKSDLAALSWHRAQFDRHLGDDMWMKKSERKS
jgi:hypothetical protein